MIDLEKRAKAWDEFMDEPRDLTIGDTFNAAYAAGFLDGAASVDRVAIVREAFAKVEEQMKGSPYWAIERDGERFRHCANAVLADMESEPGLF